MGDFELPGNPAIPVVLRRSARARRISLRLSQLDGRVTLTMPSHASEREAMDFARDKADWLRHHLAQRASDEVARFGAEIPVEGRNRTIAQGTGRRVIDDGGALRVPGADAQVGRRLEAYLKQRARDRLAAASDLYAERLGRPYTRLTIRDTRSRWGSCTAEGRLMYSWRLILAPPEVLSYVAAHEVAHLQEMNHSDRFWHVVEDLYGDWRQARGWLQNEGAALHRYRFGN